MRPQTCENIKQDPLNEVQITIDIIQQTRRLVRGMDQRQRFQIAQKHLLNALEQKTPRLDTYSENVTKRFKICYNLQTSTAWQYFLLLISYLFMYLIIWGFKPVPKLTIAFQFLILLLAWIDVIMEIYHKKFEVLRISSRFQLRFYARTIVLMLLVIDQVLVFIAPDWKIRPLIIFRCLLPLFYDINVRKAFQALLSSYKDILVFLIFYTFVILCFAIIANQIIQLPKNADVDEYRSDYRDLGKTIFIMYVLATYDSYPANQLVAIKQSMWIYAFFICFIMLNAFFFVNIPVTLIFNSFRETRSKLLLIDEIRQQHSLIMSFVSLGQQNLSIEQNKMIEFMLYVYKNKVRYVDHITSICRKLDHHNDGVIQVNQYMQLCKILQQNHEMLPPKFHDWKRWIMFRRRINSIFGLKKLVESNVFKVCNCIIIIITFINAILSLYTPFKIFDIIDDFSILFFVVQLILKFVGLGFQNFLKDPWNKLDTFIILLGFFFEVAPENIIPHNGDLLFKMARIFRITSLLKYAFIGQKTSESDIYLKATKLISQTAIIIPTVLRFFPFFLVTFYSITILAMSIFQQSNIINTSESPYEDDYGVYSNFRSFIYSHFLLIQILVESQWSSIAYNHVFKFGNYPFVMLFFVSVHFLIVTIISSLIKGVIWEVYNTISEQFNSRNTRRLITKAHEQEMQKKKQQIQQIKVKNQQKEMLVPDSIITKELYQNKIDLQIIRSLRQLYKKNPLIFESKKKIKKSEMYNHMMKQSSSSSSLNEKIQEDEISIHISQIQTPQSNKRMVINRLKSLPSIQQIEDLHEEDIEWQMERMLSQVILNHKVKFSATIIHPETLQQFLRKKLKSVDKNSFKADFNIGTDVISNKKSAKFLSHGLNALLQIQTSERQQKVMIIDSMVKNGMITHDESVRILQKKPVYKDSDFDSNWIMRKAFLSDTNQQLIKNFQIEYFSNIYGKSFTQINKVTIQPLIRLQARLTYCLKNVLRYSEMGQRQFFSILSTIQSTISNKLMKKGSLFKFIYQINSLDYWFSVQLMQSHELRIHFIKNGIWIESKYLKPNQIYHAKDLFNWENIQARQDRSTCQRYIKMLYQSFETLAFCLNNQQDFFETDPIKHYFDLFTFYRQVNQVQRLKKQNISISKIMLVVLLKQDERKQPLGYNLSNIKFDYQKIRMKKQMKFKFDESQNQTFQKLKRIELMDYQKIIENEGFPFPYIINLMKQVQEILQLHQVNFVNQLEELFNKVIFEQHLSTEQ